MNRDFSRSNEWLLDPKHLIFSLARYKFVSKMVEGCWKVLEVGAGDGVASEIVYQRVNWLVRTDKNPAGELVWRHDILEAPIPDGEFDAAYALDVIEHIKPEETDTFLANMRASVNDKGVVIIGSPSLESQPYASEGSKAEHINCMTATDLRAAMWRAKFWPVFMFGMNDEVLHVGFEQMRHYNFAIGVR